MSRKVPCNDCGDPCCGKRCRSCYVAWMISQGQTEEYRRKQSEISLTAWQDPEYRRKQSKSQTEAQNRPEVKTKKSRALTELWNQSGYRQQIISTITEIWDESQFRQRVSRGVAAAHARGDFSSSATKQRKSDAAKAMWQNPDYYQKQVKAQLEAQNRPEVKKKRSDANRGERNPCWRGGIPREPYALDWPEIRKTIRERDGHKCQICNEYGKYVHHIDYNPKNNSPTNLITLCPLHHNRTTFGNRDYWQSYFTRVSHDSILKAIPKRENFRFMQTT